VPTSVPPPSDAPLAARLRCGNRRATTPVRRNERARREHPPHSGKTTRWPASCSRQDELRSHVRAQRAGDLATARDSCLGRAASVSRRAIGGPSRSCIRERQERRADCSYPCNAAVGASSTVRVRHDVHEGVLRPSEFVGGARIRTRDTMIRARVHRRDTGSRCGPGALPMPVDARRYPRIRRVEKRFRPRNRPSWPKPGPVAGGHALRNYPICSDFAMARPGLEPGTPRFSGSCRARLRGVKALQIGSGLPRELVRNALVWLGFARVWDSVPPSKSQ
jgi:hypothetical protein